VTENGGVLSYADREAGQLRFASFTMARLTGTLFLAGEPVAVSRNWAVDQLGVNFSEPQARFAVVAGRPGKGIVDRGVTVCSCFGVGVKQIAASSRAGASLSTR
jgi:assimilatory nitrate reductase catalytic subunit